MLGKRRFVVVKGKSEFCFNESAAIFQHYEVLVQKICYALCYQTYPSIMFSQIYFGNIVNRLTPVSSHKSWKSFHFLKRLFHASKCISHISYKQIFIDRTLMQKVSYNGWIHQI